MTNYTQFQHQKIKQNIGLACCDSTSPPDVPQSYANLSFTLLLGFRGALLIIVTMLPSAVGDGYKSFIMVKFYKEYIVFHFHTHGSKMYSLKVLSRLSKIKTAHY